MKEVSVLGIDLAKSVFQLHGNDAAGRVVLKKKLRRSQLCSFLSSLPHCVVAMEACGSAHFWGRAIVEMGHELRMIPPQYVKAYVKTNKSDAADAEAIAEAAVRRNLHFVPLKTVEQVDLQAILRVRRRIVGNRIALTNEMRAVLFEQGIVTAQGIPSLKTLVRGIISNQIESHVTHSCRTTLADLHAELIDLEERLRVIDERMEHFTEDDDLCRKLKTVPGVGTVTAAALRAAVGNPHVFRNGRHMAAWLGLVPRHEGTGGKCRVLGISKRGDGYLRSLLVHGARSLLQKAHMKSDSFNRWAHELRCRKGWNKASVAIANKNARIIWAVMARDRVFDATLACAA